MKFCVIFISDVNECSGVNDCQQECENTPGSYNCSCYEGFELASNEKSCNGLLLLCIAILLSIDPYHFIFLSLVLTECPESNVCTHICAIINVTQTCFCNLGYELAAGSSAQCIGKFKHTVV